MQYKLVYNSNYNNKKLVIKFNEIVMFLLIFGIYALNRTSSVENREYGWLIIIGLTIGVSIVHIIKNRGPYLGFYSFFQLLFLGISFISRYWAYSYKLSVAGFNSLVLTAVIIFSLMNIVDSIDNFTSFIKALAWAGIFMIIYFMINNGFIYMINIRAASQSGLIKDINANDIGMKCVISAISAYVYGLSNKRKKKKYNLLAIILVIFSLFTGSRKVIVMLGFCFSLLYVFEKKANKMLRFIIVAIGISFALYIIINTPFLYDIIGVRLQETFTLFEQNNLDPYSSTGIRLRMISLGIDLFKNKPMLGYGLANAELFNDGTYLHNNYLELMVGIGLVGMVAYYINPLLSIYRNRKLFKSCSDIYSLFFLLILVCFLILDYTLVSYNSREFQIIIAVASRYYVIKKNYV